MASPKEVICSVIFVVQLVVVSTKNADRPFGGPPLPSRPFLAVWNVPSSKCEVEFGVDLSLDSYNIVSNPDQKRNGTYMAIFYWNKFGLWPYFDDKNTPINGGIPQVANITAHLAKTTEDLVAGIPDPDFQGLGVIDWEKWKPLWHRNWGSQTIYKNASRDLVQNRHPDWPKEKTEAVAKEEFETAARTMFEETILLARKLRPKGFWGYYHFPACYNGKKRKNGTGYSCPEKEKELNNQIQWLFQDSTAIYPSIYLKSPFEDSQRLVDFRIKEAFRMRASRAGQHIPVYAYTRFVYVDTGEYLTKTDLIHTISQAANLGADGIVIWGSDRDIKTKEKCLKLQSYLQTTLGPFIFNVTTSAERCSQQHCSNHGRCILATGSHGNHLSFDSRQRGEVIKGKDRVETMKDIFGVSYENITEESYPGTTTNHFAWEVNKHVEFPTCKCYPGWTGKSCQDKI